jgi:hypothetical protein
MNKKEDTLTQSQMLRTTDSADFIATQIPEICCLEKMKVFQYCNITDLPPLTGLGAVVFLAITPTRVQACHQPWQRRNHYAMYVLGAETGPQR